jgi:hypothetical protein
MRVERLFEYTEDAIVGQFTAATGPFFAELQKYPALFVEEDYGQQQQQQFAHVGRVLNPKIAGRDVEFEVVFERATPPIAQAELHRLSRNLHISTSGRGLTEFNRNHWAVKDVDLYRIIHTELRQAIRAPTAFRLPSHPQIDARLVSVMMPFAVEFNPVFHSIQSACLGVGLACTRADNIWENPAIIDDVVNLIDRAAVVIFDCSGKNANVFYELGLAHAWGKEVIIITNDPADIPFDLRHIRYIPYRNDQLSLLGTALSVRLRGLT